MKKGLLLPLLIISISAFSQQAKSDSLSRIPNCPVCKSHDQVIPIVYGKPAKETIRRAERGEIRLGGCLVGASSPRHYCRKDEKEF